MWRDVREILRDRGHTVFTPTCTGCGEREHLSRDISGDQAVGAASGALHVNDNVPLKDNLARVSQQVERTYLYKALKRNQGHLGKTASWAGITRRTLYTKMKQYGLDASDFR